MEDSATRLGGEDGAAVLASRLLELGTDGSASLVLGDDAVLEHAARMQGLAELR